MPNKEKPISVSNLPEEIDDGGTYIILQPNPNTFTHGMFKYPCKFIPEIPRWAIKKYLHHKGETVFDPFSGSGTTLLEANINGYSAWGSEIDDIAKLIIKVKTTAMSEEQIISLDSYYRKIEINVADTVYLGYHPEINNLTHWFTDDTIMKLGKIKNSIEEMEDNIIADFFRLCFVSIVKKVSNADDTSPKPYVSQKIIKTPPEAMREFSQVYRRYSIMIRELSALSLNAKSYMVEGDALNFKIERQIDLAITSPPYINAFDYGRTMRLENLWLNTLTENELRDKKKEYVGTEKINTKEEEQELSILKRSSLLDEYYNEIRSIDLKRALIVKKFFEDMEVNLQAVYDRLGNKGRYVIVIGNSLIRSVNIESWKVLKELSANIGFQSESDFSYLIQNPYIRIPRNGKGGKINKDYVLVLYKRGK
ncbi:MAG: DNA methyltransferase [Mobilitalea sp.]